MVSIVVSRTNSKRLNVPSGFASSWSADSGRKQLQAIVGSEALPSGAKQPFRKRKTNIMCIAASGQKKWVRQSFATPMQIDWDGESQT